jgi:hypothetical protein
VAQQIADPAKEIKQSHGACSYAQSHGPVAAGVRVHDLQELYALPAPYAERD